MKINKEKVYNQISLTEAKAHLREYQELQDNDVYLNMLIRAATRIAEDYINDDIASTTITIEDYDINDYQYIIKTPNLLSVSGITGDTTPITGYSIYNYYNYSIVHFASDLNTYKYIDVDNFKIVYTTGIDLNKNENIKWAILIKVGELYDFDRGNYVSNSIRKTNTFEALLDSYKISI